MRIYPDVYIIYIYITILIWRADRTVGFWPFAKAETRSRNSVNVLSVSYLNAWGAQSRTYP